MYFTIYSTVIINEFEQINAVCKSITFYDSASKR